MIDRIPHIYHNTIYAKKLFEIIKEKHLRTREVYNKISLFNDITKSSGYLLDILGQNFGIFRNGLDDEEYKRVIKFETTSFMFLGSPWEIKSVISTFFYANIKDIFIFEQSGKIIIKVPDTIDIELLKRKLKQIKTAGVGYEVVIEIYIEDYILSELAEKTLEEIESITISRR